MDAKYCLHESPEELKEVAPVPHLPYPLLHSFLIHLFNLLQTLQDCKFPYHDLYSFSVLKPSKSVSNQRNSFIPSELQVVSSFYSIKWMDKFLDRGTTRHHQLLSLSLQVSQKQSQKGLKIQQVFFCHSYLSNQCDDHYKNIDQRSELWVTKCLVLNTLSSGCIVPDFHY